MADNYLITGYWGAPHVTAENDRGINAGIFGKGKFVLPVGEQFKAEYIGNNTVRVYDGKLINNGAAAGIPAGEHVDLQIANASQGMKRNDLIVFQYEQDGSTLVESGKFVVVQGKETSGTAQDPTLTESDLLTGTATFDQMALWRVSVSGGTISAPVKVFMIKNIFDNDVAVANATTTDGIHYKATVDGLTEYREGMAIFIIPEVTSSSKQTYLNINGLGDIIMYCAKLDPSRHYGLPSSEFWLSPYLPTLVVYSENTISTPIFYAPSTFDEIINITSGGTGSRTALGALQNLGVCDTEENDFNSNNFDAWLAQVQNYVLRKVERSSKIPFFFNCGWSGHGYGTAVAWSTFDMIFVMILQDQDSVGARVYSCNPDGVWKHIAFQNP